MTGLRWLWLGLRRAGQRFRHRQDGFVAVEFVIVAPVFFFLLFAGIESGLTLTKKVMLERALDIAVRDLRIGTWSIPTQTLLRQRICDQAVVIPNCNSDLLLELVVINEDTWTMPSDRAPCIDRDLEITPLVSFNPGGSNEIMLVRACAIIDPLFPTTPWGLGLPLDASGGYAMRASTAFVNEPR